MNRRVYVAGSSKELDRCEAFAKAVERAGWEITHRWWDVIRAAGTVDANLDALILRGAAEANFAGIRKADRAVFLQPAPPIRTEGMWAEFGYACGMNAFSETGFPAGLIVVGPREWLPSCFWPLADWFFLNDAEALEAFR